jgi:hypothetical protein
MKRKKPVCECANGVKDEKEETSLRMCKRCERLRIGRLGFGTALGQTYLIGEDHVDAVVQALRGDGRAHGGGRHGGCESKFMSDGKRSVSTFHDIEFLSSICSRLTSKRSGSRPPAYLRGAGKVAEIR